jgi:undecaprenyl phosphate-alpha-L-ara4N flippase subunit ArnE
MIMTPWLILILVVLLGTVGQLSLKYAFKASSATNKDSDMREVLFSHYFWIWFISYVAVTVLWLFVLRSIPLSQAFPALGLTFALIPLASHYFLQERVEFRQWIGIVIIITGAIFVVQK